MAVEQAILGASRPAVVLLAGKGCETAQKRKNGPEPCIPDGQLAIIHILSSSPVLL